MFGRDLFDYLFNAYEVHIQKIKDGTYRVVVLQRK